MSAIQFLTSGGMASIGGDLPDDEKSEINAVIKTFGKKLKHYGFTLQVPASLLSVQQCNFLLIGKVSANYHVVFANGPGNTSIIYRDFTQHGRLDLQSIIHQIRIEIGDVVWAFSFPLNVPLPSLQDYLQQIVEQYVNTVLQSQQKPDKTISEEAVSSPEIASGLEKFRQDFPDNKKIAFIIMQFGGTKPHDEIVGCIKEELEKHNIIGLRADDKEFMDDLFSNVKVYMHACDFGIAVFDRITEDDFNPNVSLEVGYLFGLGKNILLLKEKTLKSLPTDLTGKLYKTFDTTDITTTMPQEVEKWLSDKGLI